MQLMLSNAKGPVYNISDNFKCVRCFGFHIYIYMGGGSSLLFRHI